MAINNYEYASRLKRFLNWTIDGLVISIIWIVLFIIIAPLFIKFEFGELIEKNITYDLTFTVLLIYFFYYLIFEGLFNTTIGKLITRTRLSHMSGKRVNLRKVFIRTIIRFIPLEQLSFLSENPVGWHDSLTDTREINKRKHKND